MRRSRWLVRLAVAALAAVLGAGVGQLVPSSSVAASQPYYPYPCPFVSGGRDFDGNSHEGLSVWDPRTGLWEVGEFVPDTTWGQYSDIPVPGDYNGDGSDDVAVWRPSNGTWCSSTTNCASGQIQFAWGTMGDIPVPADYNNDGYTDYGVWRPSTGTWYVRSGASTATTLVNAVAWGQYGDCPVPGRVVGASGPGELQLNVFRPSNGIWYFGRTLSGTSGGAFAFGTYGDIPFSLDLDSDGDGDFLVFRPSTGVWYGDFPVFAIQWGAPGDIPIPRGGVSGGGEPILTVWRPADQRFYNCWSPSGSSCSLGTSVEGPRGSPGVVPLVGRTE